MDNFGLPISPQFERQIYRGFYGSSGGGTSFQVYNVPQGKSMLHIFMLGAGGGGGSGVVGANSTAAGGGGGGSGGQTIIEMPIALLPPRLYVAVAAGKTAGGLASYVTTQPQIATANHIVGIANGGSGGGAAAGATAGGAGGGGSAATNATMPIGWAFSKLVLAGQAGIIGGTTIASAALTHPTTGLHVTGGTGGAGLPAAATNGTNGGAITAIAEPSNFKGLPTNTGPTSATTPATNGNSGYQYKDNGFYYIGGTGASSTHGSATGAGLVQGSGGDGGIGCGGGGMGGALTGSTAGVLSRGGDGIVIITAY
jgi:hypothetical protein